MFMHFSNHIGSLLMRQPGASTLSQCGHPLQDRPGTLGVSHWVLCGQQRSNTDIQDADVASADVRGSPEI